MAVKKKRAPNLINLVATNVRRRRADFGWSQEEFAERCGYNRTYVSAIERGERNITLTTLAALAAAFGVRAEELFSEDA